MQIGELMIKMGADVAQLRSDMGEARRTVGSAMSDIRNAVGIAQRAIVLLGGAAAVGQFANMIRGSIEASAALYDLAVQSGLTVEQLSGLVEVGKLSNTSAEQIVTGANRIAKSLTGVDEESKGAVQGLRALGINVEQFKRLSADEQYVALAKALAGATGEIEKQQVAMLILGKTGAQMLPFLKELAETEKLVAKETTENALRAKQLEDNLVKLKNVGEDWKRELANEMLPTLIRFSEELLDGRKAYDSWLKALLNAPTAKTPFENFGEAIARNREGIQQLERDLAALQKLENTPTVFGGSRKGMFDAEIKALKERLDTYKQTDAYLKSQQSREALRLGEGVADDPRIAARPRRLVVPDAGGGKDKVTEVQRLIASIRERVAAEDLEADTNAKLTAGQKLALDVMVKLRDGKLEATVAERRLLAVELERLLLQEKANTAAEAERKQSDEDRQAREQLLESLYKQTQGMRQQAEAAEAEADTIGLTTRQLQELEIARTLDAAAILQQRAEAMQLIPGYEKLAQLYREQAAALDRVANAKARGLTREDQLRADPFAGARRGLEDYRREISDVNAAAYSLVQNTARTLEDEGTAAFGRLVSTGSRAVDQLIAEVFRLAVVRPFLSTLFGSSFGGSLINGVGALLGSGGGGGGGALAPVVDAVPAVFATAAPAAGASRSGIQSLTIQQTTINHIDSRSDAAQIDEIARDRASESTRGLVTELQAAGVV